MVPPKPPKLNNLIALDPDLAHYRRDLIRRYSNLSTRLIQIKRDFGGLGGISLGHRYFGFNWGVHNAQKGIWYREWAPGAEALALVGEFNQWSGQAHPMERDGFGTWSIFLAENAQRFPVHGERIKLRVRADGETHDRIPAYIKRVVQDADSLEFSGVFWDPPAFQWSQPQPKRPQSLKIYEVHVGMSGESETVSSFDAFTDEVLPRIDRLGYNAVQLMACLEHPYYGSFGYQVSNFFAVSHRFGTPEDLKRLIDRAHGMGLLVLLDLVHSHAVKNTQEGLNWFDGTDFQYFHSGKRGEHSAWDSKCFDYGKPEVLRFLLSNIRFWLEDFQVDGFRFDGVTSMIYLDHGLGRSFTHYDQYFDPNHLDEDAIVYLQLANALTHEINPAAITIAEEVSGVPGLARPIDEGGYGFDYRLAMGIPDHWIKLLKDQRDEDWNMGELLHTLTNRRAGEDHVAYCESHDQALVGDKTIAFWLMDADMYADMAIGRPNNAIERGIALHKMIRLATFALGGEAWLNFMGNEFGHPEWVDFPRPGNQFSYRHARRQWSLVDNPFLRYQHLNAFEIAMQNLDRSFSVLCNPDIEVLAVHEDDKLLVFRRGDLVFAFNFHVWKSQASLQIGVSQQGGFRPVLDSDDAAFSGLGRRPGNATYRVAAVPAMGHASSIAVPLPNRSCLALSRCDISSQALGSNSTS